MIDKQQKKELEELIVEVIEKYDAESFRDKRTTDTPRDVYAIVNRRFVTLNGNVASRPKSSVATIGQPYFAVDTVIPMTFSVGGWVNGVGSVVAGHR